MRPLLLLALGATYLLTASVGLKAQLSVRPNDPLGYSARLPRQRIVHSIEPNLAGSSMYIQQSDPWLAYKIGAGVFSHEWTREEGVFSDFLAPSLAAGVTNSCGMCHSNPPRAPGSGPTVAEPGAFGRNVPSLFGIGLVETIAQQIRAQILEKYDLNHNGFLDVPSEVAGKNAIVEASPGVLIDFGPLDDRLNAGFPGLNDVIQLIMVDRNGLPVRNGQARATLRTPGVAGYDLATAAIASSPAIDQDASIRSFVTNAERAILGLPFEDTTLTNNSGTGRDARAGDAWVAVSNAGAQQLLVSRPPARDKTISEGEMDLLEWYLLNSPAPALGKQNVHTRHGRVLMRSMACTSCHTEDWVISPSQPGSLMRGDRRFFELTVNGETPDGHLEGHLRQLTDCKVGANGITFFVPRRGGTVVHGIYSDLRYHDLGNRFHEFRNAGGKLAATHRFRTTPLWGVGSTAPYGHDGRSLTIEDVIRRHGGEAEDARNSFVGAPPDERSDVVAFLSSLVLFQPDQIPVDLNNDGHIDANYHTSNGPAGPERFEPELLFRVPPHYRGWATGPDGDRYFSYELLNAQEAYGRLPSKTANANRNTKAVTGSSSAMAGFKGDTVSAVPGDLRISKPSTQDSTR